MLKKIVSTLAIAVVAVTAFVPMTQAHYNGYHYQDRPTNVSYTSRYNDYYTGNYYSYYTPSDYYHSYDPYNYRNHYYSDYYYDENAYGCPDNSYYNSSTGTCDCYHGYESDQGYCEHDRNDDYYYYDYDNDDFHPNYKKGRTRTRVKSAYYPYTYYTYYNDHGYNSTSKDNIRISDENYEYVKLSWDFPRRAARYTVTLYENGREEFTRTKKSYTSIKIGKRGYRRGKQMKLRVKAYDRYGVYVGQDTITFSF